MRRREGLAQAAVLPEAHGAQAEQGRGGAGGRGHLCRGASRSAANDPVPSPQSLSEIILISCENDLHLCREYFARGIGRPGPAGRGAGCERGARTRPLTASFPRRCAQRRVRPDWGAHADAGLRVISFAKAPGAARSLDGGPAGAGGARRSHRAPRVSRCVLSALSGHARSHWWTPVWKEDSLTVTVMAAVTAASPASSVAAVGWAASFGWWAPDAAGGSACAVGLWGVGLSGRAWFLSAGSPGGLQQAPGRAPSRVLPWCHRGASSLKAVFLSGLRINSTEVPAGHREPGARPCQRGRSCQRPPLQPPRFPAAFSGDKRFKAGEHVLLNMLHLFKMCDFILRNINYVLYTMTWRTLGFMIHLPGFKCFHKTSGALATNKML